MRKRLTDRLPAIVVFIAGFLLGGVFSDLTYPNPNPTEQECWLYQQKGSRTSAASTHTTPKEEEQNER